MDDHFIEQNENNQSKHFTGFKPKKIWITKNELYLMPEYSSSLPGLTTIGFKWKTYYPSSHCNFLVKEFINHRGGDPSMVSIEVYDVIFVKRDDNG